MTVSAARLMGAECIITGISSRISQTMVNLGVDLTGIITRGVLADGLKLAFELSGQRVPTEGD
jgi:rsbT co-antagonist protein RsbR